MDHYELKASRWPTRAEWRNLVVAQNSTGRLVFCLLKPNRWAKNRLSKHRPRTRPAAVALLSLSRQQKQYWRSRKSSSRSRSGKKRVTREKIWWTESKVRVDMRQERFYLLTDNLSSVRAWRRAFPITVISFVKGKMSLRFSWGRKSNKNLRAAKRKRGKRRITFVQSLSVNKAIRSYRNLHSDSECFVLSNFSTKQFPLQIFRLVNDKRTVLSDQELTFTFLVFQVTPWIPPNPQMYRTKLKINLSTKRDASTCQTQKAFHGNENKNGNHENSVISANNKTMKRRKKKKTRKKLGAHSP